MAAQVTPELAARGIHINPTATPLDDRRKRTERVY